MVANKLLQHLKNKGSELYPQSLEIRRALSASVAILLSIFVDNHFSNLHQFWVPLITVIILLSRAKSDLQTVFINFVGVVIGLAFAVFIAKLNLSTQEINLLIAAVLLLSFVKESVTRLSAVTMVIPGLLYLFWQHHWPAIPFYDLLREASFAAVISAIATAFIFPERPDVDFRQGLIPVFEAYRAYLASVIQYLFDKKAYEQISFEKKIQAMKTLQDDESVFPEWVYRLGFSAFFRQGHRHFLVRTEQIGTVLFAMHQIARFDINKKILTSFEKEILAAVQTIDTLFAGIIERLELKSVKLPATKLHSKIEELDKALATIAPPSVELLDVSEDYLHIAGLIYELKDLQKLSVKLAEALR